MNEGDLRVWWIPQVPMKAFYVKVGSAKEGKFLMEALAQYDLFQFENKIKPDYSNAGGVQIFENGEWTEWENEDGESIDEVDY